VVTDLLPVPVRGLAGGCRPLPLWAGAMRLRALGAGIGMSTEVDDTSIIVVPLAVVLTEGIDELDIVATVSGNIIQRSQHYG